ncbi:hypothetical protein SPHINGO8AM_90100 [Sphingomonas sp. 8AM]|nr:hypothetical protein SPHINGO8AM_90100 [Sphingomonas sp. 8AM]
MMGRVRADEVVLMTNQRASCPPPLTAQIRKERPVAGPLLCDNQQRQNGPDRFGNPEPPVS